MGCANCGTGGGGCGGSCGSNGKLPVFDWLSNMRLPQSQSTFDCVEVRFKNDRKSFFRNTNNLPLYVGDIIAVEAQNGHDIGSITMTGELVRLQMRKKKVSEDSEEIRKIYRKANEKDIETWKNSREKEDEVKKEARKLAYGLGLEMKISDVEFQGDGTKAVFYYTAEGRVDFRELIKLYAATFGIRIEMKQIGYRQEAAKIGGIGSSGRELCCSTWLTDFRSVNTSAARYQQLSINPQKLAGQCGKLKCCLNFELDSYLDALNDFPSIETTFETEKGQVHCVKIDVFKREMWFAYDEGGMTWYKFSVEQIKKFIELNKEGKKTASLEDLTKEMDDFLTKKEFVDVIGENSLERFEKKRKRSRKKAKPTNNPQNKQKKEAKKTPPKKEKKTTQEKPNTNKQETVNKSASKPNPNRNKNKRFKNNKKRPPFTKGNEEQ